MAESMTLDEKFALSELRRHMRAELPTEIYDNTTLLLKFLTARDLNVKQAESMLRKNLRWKKEMQMDTLLKDFIPSELLVKYIGISSIGYDKEGYPVTYVAAGTCDGRGIFKSTNFLYFYKYLLQLVERDIILQEQQSEKLGKSITQSVTIYNVANLDVSQVTHKLTVQNVLNGIMIFQDNYPEVLRRIYIINASVYFTFIWPVVVKCLGSGLVNKIHVFGKDGWKEELLKMMDADQLPAFLGGKRTDPDGNPLCSSFINYAGPVPESYYQLKDISRFLQKSDIILEKIERQSSISIPHQITNPKSIINWEFELKNHDIGFGILLEKSDAKFEELIPIHKLKTELEPYSGMYRCQYPGKYLMVFDNTHSWFYSKEVYYRTWITESDE